MRTVCLSKQPILTVEALLEQFWGLLFEANIPQFPRSPMKVGTILVPIPAPALGHHCASGTPGLSVNQVKAHERTRKVFLVLLRICLLEGLSTDPNCILQAPHGKQVSFILYPTGITFSPKSGKHSFLPTSLCFSRLNISFFNHCW